jgi:hypothetical protein
MGSLRSSLFHSDGCIRGNIRVKTFRAVLTPVCKHTKIKATIIDFTAENQIAAESYIRNGWLRIPQMQVHSVTEIGPAGEMRLDRWPCIDGTAKL